MTKRKRNPELMFHTRIREILNGISQEAQV
jgi:hypothetical protein